MVHFKTRTLSFFLVLYCKHRYPCIRKCAVNLLITFKEWSIHLDSFSDLKRFKDKRQGILSLLLSYPK